MAKKKTPVKRSKRAAKSRSLSKSVNLSFRNVLLFAAAFALVGVFYWALSNALGNDTVKPFKEDRSRGLVWSGIRPSTGACIKAFELFDSHGKPQGCTHGPDPSVDGLDPTKSVQPLISGETTSAQTTSGITCDGDGVSGYRIQALYVHAADQVDRYGQFAASFPVYASNIDNIMYQSSVKSGNSRHYRFVTDAGCNLTVPDVTLSTTGDDNFANTASELKNLGYNRTDRHYLVWMDSTIYCGIAGLYTDSRADQTNPNNSGPLYGRIDSGCWGGGAEAHELMHTLGAVQNDAPDSSGGMHCNDGWDRMCYSDGGSTSNYTTTTCPDSSYQNIYDCNFNDYFNSSGSIPATNYLATHWNTANNRFLIAAATITPPPPPSTTDTTPPVVIISSPTDNSAVGGRVNIVASATDNVRVTKMELYIDGKLIKSSTTASISFTWNARKASAGQHSITAQAYDAAGNVGKQTILVVR